MLTRYPREQWDAHPNLGAMARFWLSRHAMFRELSAAIEGITMNFRAGQLPPAEFFAELLDHYLLAVLHGLLYESLAAENRQRLAHMEHALHRLEERVARLALKRNALRQEKIIEELEVILSSEQAFAKAN